MGDPRTAILNRIMMRVFSSDDVRYCWRFLAFVFLEGRHQRQILCGGARDIGRVKLVPCVIKKRTRARIAQTPIKIF